MVFATYQHNISQMEAGSGGPSYGYAFSEVLNRVLIVDLERRSAIVSVDSEVTGTGVAVSPGGDRVYAVSPGRDSLQVGELGTLRVVATIPVGLGAEHITLTADRRLLVPASQAGFLSVIETTTDTLAAKVPIRGAHHAVEDPDGSRIYVSSPETGQVTVLDSATLELTGVVEVPGRPAMLAVSGAAGLIIAASIDLGILYFADTESLQIIGEVRVGREPHALAATPEGRLLVANFGEGTVSVYDIRERKVIATVEVPGEPHDLMLLSPSTAVVVGGPSGTLSFLNLRTLQVTGVIQTGGPIHAMVIAGPTIASLSEPLMEEELESDNFSCGA
jgi:YVTN family beta-propeller protein